MRSAALAAANELVIGNRQDDYGTPQQNFGSIAELWSTYLRALNMGDELTAADVAAMLVLVKVARIATSPGKEDNWVDIAGYAACGAEVTHSDSSGG